MSPISLTQRVLRRMPPGCGEAVAAGWTSVARTHVGHKRQINEDRILSCPERGLWAVADGMGGHSGGDLAADMAINALRELAHGGEPIRHSDIEIALQQANTRIRERGLSTNSVIGTTIVALHLSETEGTLFWAGDSRAYQVRKGRLEQLTRDHSLVQELVDAGAITREAALTHPRANVVTRALGVDADVDLETRSISVRPGDLVLLCSDGLSRSLTAHAFARAVEFGEPLADQLLQETLARDGSDNISFVAVQVDGAADAGSLTRAV